MSKLTYMQKILYCIYMLKGHHTPSKVMKFGWSILIDVVMKTVSFCLQSGFASLSIKGYTFLL